jgi:hypothetical protein
MCGKIFVFREKLRVFLYVWKNYDMFGKNLYVRKKICDLSSPPQLANIFEKRNIN